MGRGGGVPSGRPPSQAAYFVALAVIALLLLMLCCYFLYFCVKKINGLEGGIIVRGSVPSGRPPSQAAYFVALAVIALLLLMLCCYFLYFCVKKINELSEHESLCGAPASRAQPTPARDAYPVQPVVRESATAMAKLCKELPSGGRGLVFPAATSPAALLADTGAGGSLASGSDGATLSDDTVTTGASEEPAPGARR